MFRAQHLTATLILTLLCECSLGQDTPGGQYSLGCKLSSQGATSVPDRNSHCDSSFECESGFFKMTLNSFTPNNIAGSQTPSTTLSYVCVSDCASRSTHYANLTTRTCNSCRYPCSKCNQGVCQETCSMTNNSTYVAHCFTSLPTCYLSDDIYKVGSSCEFGCPRGNYRNTVSKTCELCNLSCYECTGPASSECTSCQAGYYLSTQFNTATNSYNNYGSCVVKTATSPFSKQDILVSHRAQDRQGAKLESTRQGGTSDPYTDLRSAINRAEELMARYSQDSLNVTIYLTKGPHYITLNDSYYKPVGTIDNQNQNYRLIIKPLESGNPFGITDQTMLVPTGEKVTIINKIGAYFHIEVPHSLEIYRVIFDSLDSMGSWNTQCLASHSRICQINSSTKAISDDTSSGMACTCASPSMQSLNNCVTPLATSFIKMDYKNASYATPKSILVKDCEFQHFFYSLNALIDISGGPALLNIVNSVFQKFSICGAIVKNQNDVYLGQRNTGTISQPTYTSVSEDKDQKLIEDESVYSYSSQVSICNSPDSDQSYGKNCAYVNVESSEFRDFDYYFSVQPSLSGTTSGLSEDYQSGKTNRYRASVFYLKDYNGLVRVIGSTFQNLFLKRSECYYNSSFNTFDVNVSNQKNVGYTFSAQEYLKIENPVIITENRHGILFRDNTVKGVSGTRGFLYATIKRDNKNVTLIQNNKFQNVAGFYGSGVMHFTQFQKSFAIDSSYGFSCGGLTIRENTFDRCFGCNDTAPLIRVDCASQDSDSSYKDYYFETSILTDWTNNVGDFNDSLGSLQYGSDIESGLTTRGVLLEGNTFSKTHRGSNAQVILINHVPSVKILNTKIELSSSFQHMDVQNSQLQTEYLASFGNKTLLP